MKTQVTEIAFSINDALLASLKKQISENERVQQEIPESELQNELGKLSIEYADGGHAYTDQDSGNLYHASYYAQCEVHYSGNHPAMEQAVYELEYPSDDE